MGSKRTGPRNRVYRRSRYVQLGLPVALAALAVLVGIVVWTVRDSPRGSGDPVLVSAITDEFPGNHLHGIGFDRERERLYLATHFGLFYLQYAEDRWTLYQLGDRRDDFMGFALDPHSPDVMFTSGHPVGGGNFGVLRTEDGGRSFEQVFEGPGGNAIDFHSMTISSADTSVLYGHYWGDGMLYRTTDGGETWESLSPGQLPDRGPCWAAPCLAADPREPDTVWAGTDEGLMVSNDGGRNWQPTSLRDPVAGVGVSAEPRPRILAMVPGQGLFVSSDDGETWSSTGEGLNLSDREFVFQLTFDANDPRRVFAATTEQQVFESRDGGSNWEPILP